MAGRPKRRAQDLLHRAVMARDNLSRIRHIARVIASQTARSNSGKGYGSRRITFADLIAGSDIRQGWLKELLESSPIYRAAPAPGRQIGVHATKADFESEFWVDLLSAAKESSRTWEQWQELAKNTLEYTSKRLFSDFKKLKHSPFGSGVPAASSGEDEFGRPGTEQHPGIGQSVEIQQPETAHDLWEERLHSDSTQKYLTQFLNRPPYDSSEDAKRSAEREKMTFLLTFWFLFAEIRLLQKDQLDKAAARIAELRVQADEDEEDGYPELARLNRREADARQKVLSKLEKEYTALVTLMGRAKKAVSTVPRAEEGRAKALAMYKAQSSYVQNSRRVRGVQPSDHKKVPNFYGYAPKDIAKALYGPGAMGLAMVTEPQAKFRIMLGRISDEDWGDLGMRPRSPRSARRPRGKKI